MRDWRSNSGEHGEEGGSNGVAPGRRALTDSIQRRAAAPADEEAGRDGPAAGAGLAAPLAGSGPSAGSPLPGPVQAKMEDAFDFSFAQVRVHEGAQAESVGAVAYAQGTDLHFAPGQYDPGSQRGQELIGHELAHVVQQSEGRAAATTQYKGVEVNDDPGLESEADTWGAQAARGEPVARSGGSREPSGGAVQRKLIQRAAQQSHWGRFIDTSYAVHATGVNMKMDFAPDPVVDATSIGFTQTARTQSHGADVSHDPTIRDHTVAAGAVGEGQFVDRLSDRNNPVYGSTNLAPGTGTDATAVRSGAEATPVGTGALERRYELGHRFTDATGDHTKNAEMADGPGGLGRDSGMIFETTVVALAGTQQGTYYGSVRWGFERNAANVVTPIPFALISEGVPTAGFLAAAEAWNAGTVRGTLSTTAASTDVLDAPGGAVSFTVVAATTVTDRGAVSLAGVPFRRVNITSGAHAGDTGYIRVSDLSDAGDGGATANLPTPGISTLVADEALNDGVPGPWRDVDVVPAGTRVEPTARTHGLGPMDKIWVKVAQGPLTGKEGFIERANMIAEPR